MMEELGGTGITLAKQYEGVVNKIMKSIENKNDDWFVDDLYLDALSESEYRQYEAEMMEDDEIELY